MRIWWLNQSIVYPLAFATRGNHPGAPQVGKMSRDLRLIDLQNLHKETHANLVVSDEIYQPQTSVIRECLKQKCDAIFFVAHAVLFTCFGGSYYDFCSIRVPFLATNLGAKGAIFYPNLAPEN
jgi:hypothetical protein